MGWKCFEVEVLWTEVGRQLFWALRVAGNARQANALEAATNCHHFLRRLQLSTQQQIGRPKSSCPVSKEDRTAWARHTLQVTSGLVHFPWREIFVLRLRAKSESLDQTLKIWNCFGPECTVSLA